MLHENVHHWSMPKACYLYNFQLSIILCVFRYNSKDLYQVFFNEILTDAIKCSKKPLHHDDWSRINFHQIPFDLQKGLI